MNTTVSTGPQSDGQYKLYRVSTLFTGFLRMWRAWKFVLPTLIINALVQGLLVLPTFPAGYSPLFLLTVVLSAAVLLASAAVVTAAALDSAVGATTWSSAWERIRNHGVGFALWIIALAVVVVIGIGIGTWPGLLIAAILPFLTVAALDGSHNPLVTNFRVIVSRPFRWLITMIIIGMIAFFMWVLMALNGFFVPVFVAAVVACFIGGLLTWWWQTALALIYQSTHESDSSSVDEGAS